MSGDRQVVASAYGASVHVSAPAGVIAGLTQLISPYIDVAPADGPVHAPHVRVCDSPPSQDVWRRMVLESEYEPDRVVWVDDTRRRMALANEDEGWTVQQLLRSVRYLLRWQAYERGDLFLHGGLVRAENTGIAFLGHKRSGKTSSILSALLNGGADFVSNDDLVLTDADGDAGALTGYGSPRTVNVRTDALLALARDTPALLSLLSDTSHPTNAFPGRHHTRDAIHSDTGDRLPGSVWVRCAELAHVTGRSLLPESRVDMVVLPGFDSATDGPDMTRLTPQEAYQALSEHVEDNATKYDPYLAAWFPATHADRRTRLLRRLADRTPCYRLTQDMGRLADATSLLLATRAAAGPVS
ncbi:hypothetical protein [Streptomyces sp. NBC_00316]|uniref:hypothetical protein n=1 Tax=Streptomyces sp. NBC_00316 TaxID=2975710 RepID=UPI002E2AF636|nr:hypothetical protein [Streptomyces sp. NBC_00316]